VIFSFAEIFQLSVEELCERSSKRYVPLNKRVEGAQQTLQSVKKSIGESGHFCGTPSNT
jgi:hypothetical protein